MTENKNTLQTNRRGFLAASLSVPAVLAASNVLAQTTTASSAGAVEEDTRSLDELYEEAKAEGGELIVYAGGDTATQQDFTKNAFTKRFPDMKINIVVDYSKFHDVRLDNQFATDTVVPDVVQLQTIQNFDRWAKEGRLMPYKPAGFSKIYDGFKDSNGAWMSVIVIPFSFQYDIAAVGDDAPKNAGDLADPKWKGKIASSYPQDDDAVLYLFKTYVEAYGWEWVSKMAEQDLQFARGSHTPALAVNNGEKAIGLGGSGSPIVRPDAKTKFVVPEDGPFMAWGQRGAILKQAKHPAAARLYMAWSASEEMQKTAWSGWSTRTDIEPTNGLKQIWEIENANVPGFVEFMADRAEVERWRNQFILYFGEVKGEPSPGWLGLHPGKA